MSLVVRHKTKLQRMVATVSHELVILAYIIKVELTAVNMKWAFEMLLFLTSVYVLIEIVQPVTAVE